MQKKLHKAHGQRNLKIKDEKFEIKITECQWLLGYPYYSTIVSIDEMTP